MKEAVKCDTSPFKRLFQKNSVLVNGNSEPIVFEEHKHTTISMEGIGPEIQTMAVEKLCSFKRPLMGAFRFFYAFVAAKCTNLDRKWGELISTSNPLVLVSGRFFADMELALLFVRFSNKKSSITLVIACGIR